MAANCFGLLQKLLNKNFGKPPFPSLIYENEILSTTKGNASFFVKQFTSTSTYKDQDNHPLSTVTAAPYNMPKVSF